MGGMSPGQLVAPLYEIPVNTTGAVRSFGGHFGWMECGVMGTRVWEDEAGSKRGEETSERVVS